MITKRYPRGLYAPELLESRIAPATIVVHNLNDNGAGSLRQAVIDANDQATHPGPDTITFDHALNGTIILTGGEIDITDTLTIKGPGVDKIAIDGNGASRIFNIDDNDTGKLHPATISGLTVFDGSATGQGGAIRSVESLTLKNVVVANSTATGGGGGLYVKTQGNITVVSSKILDNHANGDSGGAALKAAGPIVVAKTVISGNSTAGRGGGVYLYGSGSKPSKVTVFACTIAANTAPDNGGGILIDFHNKDSLVSIANSRVSGNSGSRGGGLYLDGGKLTLTNSSFTNNTAAVNGGGIADEFANGLKIIGSDFENNTSGGAGGALYTRGDPVVAITGTIFAGNKSTTNGGGIAAVDATVISVTSSLLDGNSTPASGGAIFVAAAGSKLRLTSSVVTGNTAVGGGGIYGEAGAKVITSGGVFTGNHATNGSGGAILTTGSAADAVKLSITGTKFAGNSASQGGAVLTEGDGAVSVVGAKVVGNFTTSEDGGGMYLRSTTTVFVEGSLFSGNVSKDDGGGLALRGGDVKLISSQFIDNSADGDDGGGVIIFGGSKLAMTNVLITGNVAKDDGGGLNDDSGGTTLITKVATTITGNWAKTNPNIA